MALGATPLFAVIVRGYDPPIFAAGVPLKVAVPLPLSTNVTPVGNAPASLSAGFGLPVVVTVNVPAMPTVKVVVAALVIVGATGVGLTVRVKDWVALGAMPLFAVIVKGYDPTVPTAGVPLNVAVPLPLSTNVTPAGNTPASFNAALGLPVVVTVKVPAMPTANVAFAALVIVGA